jgi:outer membrane protein assembly factor BamB
VVTNGSIASCYDAQTGKMLIGKGWERPASSTPHPSPPTATSTPRPTTAWVVFKAGDHCQVLARNNLGEQIVATPALVDGRVYVRTEGHLYAFGGSDL